MSHAFKARALLAFALVSIVGVAGAAAPPASAAPAAAAHKPDAAAGAKKFADACAECHDREDLTGDDLKSFRDELRGVASGQKNHTKKKKLKLPAAEIDALAAWLATLK